MQGIGQLCLEISCTVHVKPLHEKRTLRTTEAMLTSLIHAHTCARNASRNAPLSKATSVLACQGLIVLPCVREPRHVAIAGLAGIISTGCTPVFFFKDLGKPWFHISSKSGNSRNWVLNVNVLLLPQPAQMLYAISVGDLEATAKTCLKTSF